PDRPLDLVIHARDLELHRVLGSVARGHADGRGALDGELALRIAGGGAALQRAVLRARPRGTLQLSDPAWRAQVSASAAGFALHQRIAATLADFEYLRLVAVLHPAGSDPDLQITVQGRGKQIAQDLELTINLRGLRSAARRPSSAPHPAPSPRSKP
ncbi:MAG TPA: YdbH domain-containing protein, partial [Kofleriaceae bacterium]|nr:YdbH domain-containing protein [Kofleriaceae bacterium]